MKKYYSAQRVEYLKTEKQIISLSKGWLLDNSKLPNSYKSHYFTDLEQSSMADAYGWFIFKIMKTVPGSERLSINHKFTINDSINQPITNYSRFIFDKEFNLLGMYYSFDSTDVKYNTFNYTIENWKTRFGH